MSGQTGDAVVLILGSGPNVIEATDWRRDWFDSIIAINNAWRVRPDWDHLIFPEDFPKDRWPETVEASQGFVEADQFVPAQNRFGGFVFGGATMAFTAAYWALDALRPRVMAFMGCDMTYRSTGATHFYGRGAPDPLRDDISLRDLSAKSARLGAIAADLGCLCLNLSTAPSSLLFERGRAADLRTAPPPPRPDTSALESLRQSESALGYETPTGRYGHLAETADLAALDKLDEAWRSLFVETVAPVGGTDLS